MIKMMNYFTAFAAATLLLGSCTKGLGWEEEQNGGQTTPDIPTKGELVLTADKYEIEADGEDYAQLTVTMGGVEVPASMLTIYNDKNEKVSLPEMQFTTTTIGKHYLWAAYNTSCTETIEIKAVKPTEGGSGVNPGPAPGDDSNNLDFKRRVLMIQFTGTGCGYCPYMINTLQSMMQITDVKNSAILVAAHRYNQNDPAYLTGATLNYAMSVSGYPTLNFDMYTNSQQSQSVDYNIDLLNTCLKRGGIRGGIAAVSSYDSTTRTVNISAQVKAAEEYDFRIGAWVIEDGIVGTQANYGAPGEWTDFVHNNCVRFCDSKRSSTDFTGHDLGTISKGATADYNFTIELDEAWDDSKCRLVLFITTPETITGAKKYYVNNAITLPLTGEKGYDYNE